MMLKLLFMALLATAHSTTQNADISKYKSETAKNNFAEQRTSLLSMKSLKDLDKPFEAQRQREFRGTLLSFAQYFKIPKGLKRRSVLFDAGTIGCSNFGCSADKAINKNIKSTRAPFFITKKPTKKPKNIQTTTSKTSGTTASYTVTPEKSYKPSISSLSSVTTESAPSTTTSKIGSEPTGDSVKGSKTSASLATPSDFPELLRKLENKIKTLFKF